MCLVDGDDSGYICGALIGQNQFTLQTSSKARLAPVSTVRAIRDTTFVQQYNWANQSLCATKKCNTSVHRLDYSMTEQPYN